jgi:hypothetical protein
VQGFPAGRSSRETRHIEYIKAYGDLVRSRFGTRLDSDHITIQEKQNAVYVENQLLRSDGMSIVLILKGRIGVVPNLSTRVGYTGRVFLGVSVPFILAASSSGQCKLTGQAYLHGAMAGAVIDRFGACGNLLE